MALPAALPWIALGLETLGGFFVALGQESPEFHEFDPELKDRYKEMRGFRLGQEAIMRSTTAAVDGIENPLPSPEEMYRRWGIKASDSPVSAGMLRAAQENVDNPDLTGQLLKDRIERRHKAKAQNVGDVSKVRDLIKKERRQG